MTHVKLRISTGVAPQRPSMPELPEVEYAAQRLRAVMVGRTISTAEALHPSLARTLTPDAAARLVGQLVLRVERRAKIQLVHVADGHILEVHFRMTGDWDVGRVADPAPALERARFTLDDGTRISFVDSRALGILRLHPPGASFLPSLGPEPLLDDFSPAALQSALASRRGPIKPVLLDQQVVAGLGNIYATEALWEARIDPARPADRISAARVARLRDAIRLVLQAAPAGRYYAPVGANATSAAANHDDGWRVYGRDGQPCHRCGRPITRVVQAGRSTYYCRRCQR